MISVQRTSLMLPLCFPLITLIPRGDFFSFFSLIEQRAKT